MLVGLPSDVYAQVVSLLDEAVLVQSINYLVLLGQLLDSQVILRDYAHHCVGTYQQTWSCHLRYTSTHHGTHLYSCHQLQQVQELQRAETHVDNFGTSTNHDPSADEQDDQEEHRSRFWSIALIYGPQGSSERQVVALP